MRNRVQIEVEIPSSEARNIISALEKENASGKRFASRISADGGKLSITVEAGDMVALRAAVNSYLRYLQAIEGVQAAEPEL